MSATHEQCIARARALLEAMSGLADNSPAGLWEEECAVLDGLVATMEVTYARRIDEMSDAAPSDFEQHNTLNRAMQGVV